MCARIIESCAGRGALNVPRRDRICEVEEVSHRQPANSMMTTEMTPKLSDTMLDADFVVIDGIVFETSYVRVPDEFTVADDVVLEAIHGDTELAFTQADFEDAEHVADGFYRLSDGHLVRFLSSATVH
jgi:hypothetical protein